MFKECDSQRNFKDLLLYIYIYIYDVHGLKKKKTCTQFFVHSSFSRCRVIFCRIFKERTHCAAKRRERDSSSRRESFDRFFKWDRRARTNERPVISTASELSKRISPDNFSLPFRKNLWEGISDRGGSIQISSGSWMFGKGEGGSFLLAANLREPATPSPFFDFPSHPFDNNANYKTPASSRYQLLPYLRE